MNKKDKIISYLSILRLPAIKDTLDETLIQAEKEKMTYQELLYDIFHTEVKQKQEKARLRRLKQSRLNLNKTVDNFNYEFQSSISKAQIKQLLDFEWLEQAFNLIFLGPPGVGKTHLANGIGLKAVDTGYKVIFINMDELIMVMKTSEVIKKSLQLLKKIKKADLIIIDELGYLPINKQEANDFFQLINEMYEQTSVILTSNKSLGKWGEVLGDQVITTAILDRVMHHSEIFNLTGKSYRLEHREKIINPV
ncbi:MAG: IS21-like element helper ATPase IstB [Bacillota bacterium]